MAQSLSQVYLHVIFSTKNREPYFRDRAILDEVHAYLGGACRKQDSPPMRVGGIADHVHILCALSRSRSISDLVRELKRESSRWVKTKWPGFSGFHWQDGYGAFSVSPAHVEAVREYIANQEEHHKQESFQDEFRRVLKLYRVEYDEKYVWD